MPTRKRSIMLAASLLLLSRAAAADDIHDYMTMKACVDQSDRVLVGTTPLDQSCKRTRPLRPGDPMPYHLSNYNPASDRCGARYQIHDNVDFTMNGVTRNVSVVRADYDPCSDRPQGGTPAFYEVHWFDAEYGFMMGSWSRGRTPADPGRLGANITPRCAARPASSQRYFREWIISTARVPPVGGVGYGAFSSFRPPDPLPDLSASCPKRYPGKVLAIWERGMFKYSDGATLDTIVSNPYSQSNDAGTAPGNSRQFERTYWTKLFGQTRWEAWKREDFLNKKTGLTAQALAKATYASGKCSRPFELNARPTPSFSLAPIVDDGSTYSQAATDRATNESHKWYLAECLDLSSPIRVKAEEGDAFPAFDALPKQFWEFFID